MLIYEDNERVIIILCLAVLCDKYFRVHAYIISFREMVMTNSNYLKNKRKSEMLHTFQLSNNNT